MTLFHKKKIRVMFVMLQLDAGGSEKVVLDLVTNLDPRKFEIYIATFKGGSLEPLFKDHCEKIFFIEKKPGFDFFAMLTLSRIIKSNKIDVINAHHYMPCFYSFMGAKFLNRKMFVYTEHSVPEVEQVIHCIHGKIFNLMLFRIDTVVGVSQEITEKFKISYSSHCTKFRTILNGVDIDKFSTREYREDVRARWGFSKNHFVVGMVANFRKVKNHACLVKATALLKGSYPNLRLVFVGKGFLGDPESSESEVRKLIDELGLKGRVILTGYQENIPEMLSMFDVFCLPSISEGLPVSVLEAMAAGVPVIGSQVKGLKEIIKDRETGLLFVDDNEYHLARAVEELMTSRALSQTLATKAFEYLRSTHDINTWVQEISVLFSRPSRTL